MHVLLRRTFSLWAGGTLACGAAVSLARAQTKPWASRTVRLIVPFAPGGPLDLIARMLAATLAPIIGQQVLVDNRPGGATIIGVGELVKAAGDGHTLMVDGGAAITTLPSVAKLPFDPEKDLAGVALLAQTPTLLVANAATGLRSLQHLVTRAKAMPGKLTVGIGAPGSVRQFVIDLLRKEAGVDLLQVPYKGAAPAIQALLAGEVDLYPADVSAVLPHIQSGKVVALAALSEKRAPQTPLVPTAAEQGLPSLRADNFYGLFAPGSTPPALLDRINQDITRAWNSPDIRARLAELHLQHSSSNVTSYQRLLREEALRWLPVGRASGTRVN
jgi:tripartite-type tricarboxylate transporter receptor subunit TctC